MEKMGNDHISFRDMNIKQEYHSRGEIQLNRDLVVPVLKQTKLYQRGTAFFSSFVLGTVLEGVEALYKNNGHMHLVMCPKLSKEDYEVIFRAGKTLDAVGAYLDEGIDEMLFGISDDYFELFYQMIVTGFIEIKFALTYTTGIYHDKIAIFEDFYGNKISYSGSANESRNAYEENYERVKVFKNYDGSNSYFSDDENEFNKLWSETNSELNVFNITKAIRDRVVEIVDSGKRNVKKPIGPYDYQKIPIQKWHDNNEQGFFVMATGTGKTFTACFCIRDIVKEKNPVVIILVPYIHLIDQWKQTILTVMSFDYLLEVYGANSYEWKTKMGNAFYGKKRKPDIKIVAISTIASFKSDFFQKLLGTFTFEKMLVVDEAHRISSSINTFCKENFKYLLGLSATPLRGRRLDTELLDFFGGAVYSLPIDVALEKGFLCPYNYHPIFIDTTEDDENRFRDVQRQISSCFNQEGEIRKGSEEKLTQLILKRTRVLALADLKIDKNTIMDIIDRCDLDDHFIIYCGDGHVLGNNLRHLDYIKQLFDEKDYQMNRFTCLEGMGERLELIDLFNRGVFDGFVSIKCLDEGIDIPSIKKAIIFSSNDNYREFVQRRGRILRKYEGKEVADIYDIILKPSTDCPGIAEIELRRFYEYARLAKNRFDDRLLYQLKDLIADYGINEDRIYNYFDTINEDDFMEVDENE